MSAELAELAARSLGAARAHKLTLIRTESCTAGSLAHLLSQAEGASETLHGGFVVYTKANKSAALGVPAELIAAHTAVSAQVAYAMASGALQRCPADLALAITGVAGPEPDEDGNPVGLVYVALASRTGISRARRYEFGKQSKEQICKAAFQAALSLVEELLAAKAS